MIPAARVPPRLLDADPAQLPGEEFDVVVVGSGIAGLATAVSLAAGRSVALVSKAPAPSAPWAARRDGEGATPWAQGGLAAAVGSTDRPSLHASDTEAAGGALCDSPAVGALTERGPDAVAFLVSCGVRFDRTGRTGRTGSTDRTGSTGRTAGGGSGSGRSRSTPGWTGNAPPFHLTLEGGHSRPRVLHAGGDATGSEIWSALAAAAAAAVSTWRQAFLVDVVTDPQGRARGVLLAEGGSLRVLLARAVVLATGGAGRLFSSTTAPRACTGDGIAAALRAGAELSDLEMIQFHPTALASGADPRRLVSEAVRGEGAVLVDAGGTPVMAGVDPRGDLAPRDVVSRAMHRRMTELGAAHLFLDARSLGPERIASRFPTLVENCRSMGIDPSRNPVPVSPAAHYTIGGIRTDLAGRTSVPGLFAVGEAAYTGVHGANRLASNSLLEGVVFGRAAATAISEMLGAGSGGIPAGRLSAGRPSGTERRLPPPGPMPSGASEGWLRRAMTLRCGVVREAGALASLRDDIAARIGIAVGGADRRAWETANLYLLASLVAEAAARREESRGAHFRSDFPEQWPAPPLHQRVACSGDGTLRWTFESAGTPAGGTSSTGRLGRAG